MANSQDTQGGQRDFTGVRAEICRRKISSVQTKIGSAEQTQTVQERAEK